MRCNLTFLFVLLVACLQHVAVPHLSSQHFHQQSRLTPAGSVVCSDGQRTCWVHNSTCCSTGLAAAAAAAKGLQGSSPRYHCCPLPNAVCCEDGLHCCPQCFICNVKSLTCTRPPASAAVIKMFSVLTVNNAGAQGPTKPTQHSASPTLQNPVSQKTAAQDVKKSNEPAKKENVGFVSGVIAAVKSTFFSSGAKADEKESQDKKTKTEPVQKTVPSPAVRQIPSMIPKSPVAQGQTVPHSRTTATPVPKLGNKPGFISQLHQPPGSKVGVLAAGKQPVNHPVKPSAPHPHSGGMGAGQITKQPVQPQVSGFRQQVNIQGNLKSAQPQGNVKVAPAQGTTTGKSAPAGQLKSKDTVEEKKGFFSSVISAVTDKFYPSSGKGKRTQGVAQHPANKPVGASQTKTAPKLPSKPTIASQKPQIPQVAKQAPTKSPQFQQTTGRPQNVQPSAQLKQAPSLGTRASGSQQSPQRSSTPPTNKPQIKVPIKPIVTSQKVQTPVKTQQPTVKHHVTKASPIKATAQQHKGKQHLT